MAPLQKALLRIYVIGHHVMAINTSFRASVIKQRFNHWRAVGKAAIQKRIPRNLTGRLLKGKRRYAGGCLSG